MHRAEQPPHGYTERDNNQRDICSSKTSFNKQEVQVKKLVRLNTRKSYTWVKNSILAEDIEGYAFLIAQVLSKVLTARLNSKQVESHVLAVVGVYNTEPVKTFDVFMVHNSQNDVENGIPIHIFYQLCSEPTQAAGFHMRRTILKLDTMNSRWYTHLLLNEDKKVVEKLYPHLFPNDLCRHSDQRQSHSSSLSRDSQMALTVLSNLFEGCQCNQSSLAMLKRIACLGLIVCENVHIRYSLRRDIERSLGDIGMTPQNDVLIKQVLLVGPSAASYVSLQASIMQWLSRMVSYVDSEDQTVPDVFVGCIFPGMSIRRPNPATNRKAWDVLTHLTFVERAKMYDRAFHASQYWFRQAREAIKCAETSSLRILRRLSRENVKHLGRKLGKLVTKCPLDVTKVILDQVEAYPNMIQPVVESLKYCSSLSLDVLLYQIICRLSSSKIKVKSDGQHVMMWFSSLSAFTGLLCRHFSRVDLHAIMYYIVGRLKDGQNFDMLVFSEIIKNMTGIEIIRDVSDSGMMLSSSGPYLRSTSNTLSACSLEHSRKCFSRLRNVLGSVHGDANLASSLLVLLAKSRKVIVSSEASQQLKFISQWYDESHHVLVQYVSCLHMIFTEGERTQLLPKVDDLAEKYGIEPAIIYHIFRRDVGSISRPAACTSSDSKRASEESSHFTLKSNWERMMPRELVGQISHEMYNSFWQMVLSDIFVPVALYENAFRRFSDRSNSQQASEDVPHKVVLQKLKSEHAELIAALVSCKHKLKQAAKSWILEEDPSVVARSILQHMIYPRLKMSGVDALYAAHFIDVLHEMGVPRFNILFYYDRLFRDLPQLIHSCSQSESSQVGVYMSHTFARVLRWRHESTYERECMSFKSLRLPRDSQLVQMNHANYITMLYNWHLKFTKSILTQLESSDYMELRTLLEVLVRVVNHFPILRSHGMHLQKRMEKIQNHEQRGDIQTITKRYVALLLACERTWQKASET